MSSAIWATDLPVAFPYILPSRQAPPTPPPTPTPARAAPVRRAPRPDSLLLPVLRAVESTYPSTVVRVAGVLERDHATVQAWLGTAMAGGLVFRTGDRYHLTERGLRQVRS